MFYMQKTKTAIGSHEQLASVHMKTLLINMNPTDL